MEKKRNAIEWAMHYRQIVILVVCCLIAFGIYSLPNMRKNEFPDFTIRQGLVVAVAPGNTVEEMVEQVTKPLEDYIFTYKEVKKNKTYSTTRDGIVYIQVELNDDLNNKDEFWSKFKHGVAVFKSELPQNVLAVQVVDDFGDTSALLITMESEEKTYRELDKYMEELQNRLRQIPSVGRMSVSGLQKEQISVYLDNNRLSQYGLNDQLLATTLFAKGFTTTGGQLKSDEYVQPVYVAQSFNTVYDVEQHIALLIFASMTLCVFGAAIGISIQGVDFSVTCVLGLISLMGIIVRNGIIMIDYAEELRKTEKLSVRDAIYQSARRRMRPIFLTSAAASMGVIPMILGKSGLWMPMGTVICYGTLITMVLLLTVLPVSYWLIFSGSTRKRAQQAAFENE